MSSPTRGSAGAARPEGDARLLRVSQVARQLACSTRQIWVLIQKGDLRVTRLGARSARVAVAEVERFIQAGGVRPRS